MRHQLSRRIVAIVLAAASLTAATRSAFAQRCPGDCSGDLAVTIDELVLASRAFFGTSALAACPPADADGDGAVDAADVQAALTAYTGGCGAPRAVPIGAAVGTANALVTLATVTAAPGTTAGVGATLSTMGNPVVALQQDIAFSPLTRITGCAVNPAINRAQTAFGFQPPGCDPGATCTGIRAIVISFSDLSPIADGSLLFTCSSSTSATSTRSRAARSSIGAKSPSAPAPPPATIQSTASCRAPRRRPAEPSQRTASTAC